MKKLKLFFAIILLCSFVSSSFAYYSLGPPQGYINDYAKVLSPATITSLEKQLQAYKTETKHEIAVVLINSLEGDEIETFSNQLFREWGIGLESADNGVLFLAALDDHKMRIEVGYGLEGALTDLESSLILDNIKPFLRDENYDEAVNYVVRDIMRAIKGEKIAEDSDIGSKLGIGVFFLIIFIFFFIIFLSSKGSGGSSSSSKGKKKKSFWKSSSAGSSGSSFGGFGGGSSGGGGSSSSW